ncbi:Rho GTPase-activating protein 32, partial [Araneus ventricosus]
MFEFCHEHLKGIAFTYIKDEEMIQNHKNKLLDRFENSAAITGTRSFHCFVPMSESNLKCFITSQATEYEIHSTTKTVQITLHTRDSVACVGFFPSECVEVIGDKIPHSFKLSNSSTKPVFRRHGKLIAFFRSFLLSRPSRRKLKQSGILKERVFGCDLGEHLLNTGRD